MRELLEKRVAELDEEYRAGQKVLAEMDAKRADVQQTVLRISGALQVLTELLADPAAADPAGAPAADGPGTEG